METTRFVIVLCCLFLQANCFWWDLEQRILDLDVTPSPGTGTTEEPDSEVDLTPLTCSDVAMTRKQRSLCHKGEKSMMFAIGQGVIAAKHHCRKQFKHSRWNCTVPPGQQGAFGDIALYGTAETAYLYAITSAGAAYSLTQACAAGTMSLTCGCKSRKKLEPWPNSSVEWGSCNHDVDRGVQLSRRFVDAAEEADEGVHTERQLLNLQNNNAGRLAVQDSLRTVCHCYGFKGCISKVCYQELSKFSYVAGVLKSKYHTAIRAKANSRSKKLKSWDANDGLIMSKDMVYNEPSNLCDPDIPRGILGVHGRECSTNSSDENYCSNLCCQYGHKSYLIDESYNCNCRLSWWPELHLECDTCYRRGIQKHRCK